MMIVAVVYIVVQTFLGNNSALNFKITLGVWILAAVVVNDYVEPFVKGTFDNITSRRGAVYILYAVCDAAAYACFYVFIINIGFTKEIMHYISLGLALLFFIGRIIFNNIFLGMEDITDCNN